MSRRKLYHDAKIFFLLPAELKEAAEATAAAEGLTLSQWLRRIMEEATQQQKGGKHV